MASTARFAGVLAGVALLELLMGGFLPAAADHVDLFVLLVVLNSLKGNTFRGFAGGLVAGLVQDMFTSSIYGLHSLACCVVGYGGARVSQRILTGRRVVSGLLIGAGVVVHQMIVIGLLAVLEIAQFNPGAGAMMVRALVTTAIGLAGLWVAGLARGWMEKRTKRRTLEPGRARLH